VKVSIGGVPSRGSGRLGVGAFEVVPDGVGGGIEVDDRHGRVALVHEVVLDAGGDVGGVVGVELDALAVDDGDGAAFDDGDLLFDFVIVEGDAGAGLEAADAAGDVLGADLLGDEALAAQERVRPGLRPFVEADDGHGGAV
jgi:hypothetical protein